jgi:hypothetical protein
MSEEPKGFQIVFNGKDYEVRPYTQHIAYRERKTDADELCRRLNKLRPSPTPWGDEEE